jgi:hypothetical protein
LHKSVKKTIDMELTLNIGYDQLLHLVKQLPANQIAKLNRDFYREIIPSN